MSNRTMRERWFVSGTGTGIGKTVVTAALASAARDFGCVALKPIETGGGTDAATLAQACGHPAVADWPGFFRVGPPLSPAAAVLEGEAAIDFEGLVAAIEHACADHSTALIEGAGGLFVPLTDRHDTADLASALGARVLLVAPDRLGVQSDVLGYVAAAKTRGIEIAAVILNRFGEVDPSRRTNEAVLRARLDAPVLVFERDASSIWDTLSAL